MLSYSNKQAIILNERLLTIIHYRGGSGIHLWYSRFVVLRPRFEGFAACGRAAPFWLLQLQPLDLRSAAHGLLNFNFF